MAETNSTQDAAIGATIGLAGVAVLACAAGMTKKIVDKTFASKGKERIKW